LQLEKVGRPAAAEFVRIIIRSSAAASMPRSMRIVREIPELSKD